MPSASKEDRVKAQFEETLRLVKGGNAIEGAGPLEKAESETIKYFVAWVNQGDDRVAEAVYIGALQPVGRNGRPVWELELEVRGPKQMHPGAAFGTAVIVFEEDEGLFTYTWTYPVALV